MFNTISRIIARNTYRLTYQHHRLLRNHQINFPAINRIQNKVIYRHFSDEKLGQIDEIKKLYLELTCKCSERNSYMISSLAYNKGVVIVECKNCKSKHLIADNLQWFKDERTNIEDIMREKGEKLVKTNTMEFLGDDHNKKQ